MIHCIKVLFLCQNRGILVDASFLVPMIPTLDPAPATAQPEGLSLVPEGRRVRSPSGGASFGTGDPNLGSGPGDGTARRAGPSPRRGFESGHLPFGCLFFGTDDPDLGSCPGDGTARRAGPGPRRGFASGHHPGVLLFCFFPVNLFAFSRDYVSETGFLIQSDRR